MAQFIVGLIGGAMLGAAAAAFFLPSRPATELLDYAVWTGGKQVCKDVVIEHARQVVSC